MKTIAEDLVTPSHLCNMSSISEPQQREAQQPSEEPLHDDSYEEPMVLYTSEQVKLINKIRVAFGETQRVESEQRVTKQDKNALPIVQNPPFASSTSHQDRHPMRLGTSGQVVAGEAPFASAVKAPRNWSLRDSSGLNVDSDDEVDEVEMEADAMAADTSIPMDEDKVESHPSFGPSSNTTFDPRLTYQPPPHNHDTNVEQIGTLNHNGLETVEDSAMEDAGTHRAAVAMVMDPQAIQPPPVNTFHTPSVDYGLLSNDQSYDSVQTAALGNTSMHFFQSIILSHLHAPENRLSTQTGFPQFIPSQEIAPLLVSVAQSSAILEVGVGTVEDERPDVANGSAAPALSATAGHRTTEYLSHSSFPSPSRSRPGSTPASSPTHRTIERHKHRLEDLAGVVDPCPPIVAGIQREAPPVRYAGISLDLQGTTNRSVFSSSRSRRVTVHDTDITQEQLQCLPADHTDAFLSNSGLSIASSNYSASTSATLTKSKEAMCQPVNERCVIYAFDLCFLYSSAVCYSRKEDEGTDDFTPTVAQHFTQTSPPPLPPATTIRLPPPAVPVRVAGSKRNFTDEQDAGSNSTNHAIRAPELPCVIHFFVIHFIY